MHNGGFGVAERTAYRSTILRNIVYAAREVVRYMQRAGLECVEEENQVRTLSCFSFLFSKLERFSSPCSTSRGCSWTSSCLPEEM